MLDNYSAYIEAHIRIQNARTAKDHERLARVAAASSSSRHVAGSRTLISSVTLALRSMLASVASIAH